MANGFFDDKYLEELRKRFTRKLNHDTIAQKYQRQILNGTASFEEAEKYAARAGELLADVLEDGITPDILQNGVLTEETAEKIFGTMLRDDHEAVTEAAAKVMEDLNRKAGMQMNAIRPAVETDRISGLAEKAASYEKLEDAMWLFREPVINFSQHTADRLIEENVDAHFKAGLSPRITRKATGGCCKWCASLSGKYDYPVPREIYRRHENCRCLVLYDPGDGKVQNAHTKKQYDSIEEAERESRIERAEEIERRNASKKREKLLEPLIENPQNLKNWTPEGLKAYLEKQGFKVEPLARGSLKGISFEQGGGWKINFGDGGLLQYHPERGSHHEGAYYKISTGKRGTKRYDTKGNPKPDRKNRK